MKFRFDNMDAAENAFFSRQLEHIRPGLLEVQYAELKGRSFVPVNNSMAGGTEVYTYQFMNKVGYAKIVADYGTDFPSVDVLGDEASQKIKGLGASYRYSIQEARAAQMAGEDLDMRKARAARDAVERKLDDILLLGDSDAGLPGLFSLSNTNTYTIPNGAGGGAAWSGKTSDEIVADLNAAANKIVEDSFEVEKPTRILLPTVQYNLIASKRMGDGSDQTVLSHFLGVNEYINQVMSSTRLSTAGAAGVTRMVVYNPDPMKLEAIIPQEFEQAAPMFNGFTVKTQVHLRTGGVVAYFPKSVLYADGI